jgi:hypothetical protein
MPCWLHTHVIPACRHADGTISSSSVLDAWRMASEDSDEVVPGFAAIHRLSDLRDLDETASMQMTAVSYELTHRANFSKFCRFEVRNGTP